MFSLMFKFIVNNLCDQRLKTSFEFVNNFYMMENWFCVFLTFIFDAVEVKSGLLTIYSFREKSVTHRQTSSFSKLFR